MSLALLRSICLWLPRDKTNGVVFFDRNVNAVESTSRPLERGVEDLLNHFGYHPSTRAGSTSENQNSFDWKAFARFCNSILDLISTSPQHHSLKACRTLTVKISPRTLLDYNRSLPFNAPVALLGQLRRKYQCLDTDNLYRFYFFIFLLLFRYEHFWTCNVEYVPHCKFKNVHIWKELYSNVSKKKNIQYMYLKKNQITHVR